MTPCSSQICSRGNDRSRRRAWRSRKSSNFCMSRSDNSGALNFVQGRMQTAYCRLITLNVVNLP